MLGAGGVARAVAAGAGAGRYRLTMQPPSAASSVKEARALRRMSDSNTMWGGRFADGPSAIMREINASIPFDKRLWRQDIAASRAHVAMLGAQGIVDAADVAAIDQGLAQIAPGVIAQLQ